MLWKLLEFLYGNEDTPLARIDVPGRHPKKAERECDTAILLSMTPLGLILTAPIRIITFDSDVCWRAWQTSAFSTVIAVWRRMDSKAEDHPS
jgi:hypothetical protein